LLGVLRYHIINNRTGSKSKTNLFILKLVFSSVFAYFVAQQLILGATKFWLLQHFTYVYKFKRFANL
jgi:hypothetical protein